MIDAAGGNLLGSPMYLKNNQAIESGNDNAAPFSNPENTLLTSHSLKINYRMESTVTYNRSMTVSEKPIDGFELLRSLVLSIFKQQGIDCKIGMEEASMDIVTISQSAARELVSEDGYFGVKQTSERIFQLAVGIAGGDPSKIEDIRKGIETGFQGALDAFGGWLPEISYDTYDAVMAKLDAWESA